MKIAIIGSGISGLSCAWLLTRHHPHAIVTLYEREARLGGHTNTIEVSHEGITHPIDTGFWVFNDWTYPNLIALFAHLGVPVAPSDMSFGVKLTDARGNSRLEWCGSDRWSSVFAQPSNIFRPAFWQMLSDLVRFNRDATKLAKHADLVTGTLGAYLDAHGYSRAFRDWYLRPMAACIWSTPTQKIDDFPLATFLRFCANHGLLAVNDRPQWRTVSGGARQYVERIAAVLTDVRLSAGVSAVRRAPEGVVIESARGAERFDHVVFACHSDQALALMADASDAERAALSCIPYQANVAIVHTDASLLPTRPRAWAAWNYHADFDANQPTTKVRAAEVNATESDLDAPVTLTYLINKLQPVPFKSPVMVTMNPRTPPDPAKVIRTIAYEHPVFLATSVDAKRAIRGLQGQRNTWFAGAWTRYGFHEDGLMSGVSVAKALGATIPWPTQTPAANDLTQSYPGIDTP